ncbi:MAG: ADP-ribosylglycohydrolase family protein [Verrucomicrobia bacterium]|nr:ADP-ribosylglycohydrolase family protein [Verrucomicrobiota bacterium]MBU1736204.1 ADP-ribosylglycohydrolase family protein [Verrucomicrobiota bacterium]
MHNEKQKRPLKIAYQNYYDKVLGGWMGKSLGGVIGAPFENHKMYGQKTEDNIWPDTLAINDDLDIQVVWLEAMQERGLYLSSRDLAEYWQDRCYHNYCEYGFFLNNIQRGISAPLSGTWNNSFFVESEGCPIRSEIWGFVCPGNPQLAADYARLDGQLDHGGISIEIEQFLSAAAAWAFVTNDLDAILKAGSSVISSDSSVVLVVAEVQAICKKYPEVYDAWRMIIRRYGDRDASKAITNFAIVLMALFLGKSDFKKTICICVNSGWDTDCTAATAGALLGAIGGTKGLPGDWLSKLGGNLICGVEVKHKTAPLTDFALETCLIGIEITACRNKAIEIVNAPQIAIRNRPEPRISMEAEYPETPVLWNQKSTPLNLVVRNPTAQNIEACLCLEMPANVQYDKFVSAMKLAPGQKQVVKLNVHRRMTDTWLPDKNLFLARLVSKESKEITRLTFGLGGARQWLIYGPYWDMWDKTRNKICPYRNAEINCNPSAIGYNDYYNQHVRADHPYLNESRLFQEDIPEELPLHLELGEDLITDQKTGGFKGQACYYFVRTIRSPGLVGKATLVVGRSGPCRIWFDGQQLVQYDNMRGWAPDENIECMLTGHTQRLVVKFIRLTDVMSFSLLFCGHGDPEKKRGVSIFADCLEDLPNSIRQSADQSVVFV